MQNARGNNEVHVCLLPDIHEHDCQTALTDMYQLRYLKVCRMLLRRLVLLINLQYFFSPLIKFLLRKEPKRVTGLRSFRLVNGRIPNFLLRQPVWPFAGFGFGRKVPLSLLPVCAFLYVGASRITSPSTTRMQLAIYYYYYYDKLTRSWLNFSQTLLFSLSNPN